MYSIRLWIINALKHICHKLFPSTLTMSSTTNISAPKISDSSAGKKKIKKQFFIPPSISVKFLLSQILDPNLVAFLESCTLKQFFEKLKSIISVATQTTTFKSIPTHLDVYEFSNLLVQLYGHKKNETQQSKILHNFFLMHTSQLTSKPSSPKYEYVEKEVTEESRVHFLHTIQALTKHGHNQEDNIPISNTASRKKGNKNGKVVNKKDLKSKEPKKATDKETPETSAIAKKKEKVEDSDKVKQTQNMDTDDADEDAYDSDQTNDEGY